LEVKVDVLFDNIFRDVSDRMNIIDIGVGLKNSFDPVIIL